jgi:hypothetical protein
VNGGCCNGSCVAFNMPQHCGSCGHQCLGGTPKCCPDGICIANSQSCP